MKSKKVINRKNLPSKFPFMGTVVHITALDYWNAPQWLWGITVFMLAIIWISYIRAKYTEEDEDIFDEERGYNVPNKSTLESKNSKI